MYGMVNRAIEQMVVSNHGQEVWDTICQQADISQAAFGAMETYPDEVTYALVGAASKVLGPSVDELLEAFGEYWVRYAADAGFDDMMAMFGQSMTEFLKNLDHMHSHISSAFPDLQPPSFQCDENADGTLTLKYFSAREGLAPMVKGLLTGLGERFQTPVAVDWIGKRDSERNFDEFCVVLTKAAAA